MFLPLACLLLTLGSLTFADAKSHPDNHHAYNAPPHKTLPYVLRGRRFIRTCTNEGGPCGDYVCCGGLICKNNPEEGTSFCRNSASSVQARVVLMALCPMLSALLSGSMLF